MSVQGLYNAAFRMFAVGVSLGDVLVLVLPSVETQARWDAYATGSEARVAGLGLGVLHFFLLIPTAVPCQEM